MYTVIVRHDGIDRHYAAASMFDAIVLFEALARQFSRVELWEGKTLKREFSA